MKQNEASTQAKKPECCQNEGDSISHFSYSELNSPN